MCFALRVLLFWTLSAQAVTPEERLADLVSEDPAVSAEALLLLQKTGGVDARLRATGFSYLPPQVDELRPTFEVFAGQWTTAPRVSDLWNHRGKAWMVVKLLNDVRRDLQKALPREQLTVWNVGGNLLTTSSEAAGGPLVVVKALRSLASIFRNHVGTYPQGMVEDYFARPGTPVFAADFHHYGFARQLGLLEALRIAETLPELAPATREALLSLWLTSFVETALQMQGMETAREAPQLIRALNQAWAAAFARLERPELALEAAWETFDTFAHGQDRTHWAESGVRSLRTLLQLLVEPEAPTTHGFFSGLRSRLNGPRANAEHLVALTAYLEELHRGEGTPKHWVSYSSLARGAALACSVPARACALAASLPVRAAEWPVSLVAGLFKSTPSRRTSESLRRCGALLLKAQVR